MARELFAPWAEVVPGAHPMTAEDLLAMPDDGWQYELVEGRLVRMPGSGSEPSSIASYLASLLIAYVRPRRLGRVTGSDGEYRLSLLGQPETALIPDVAFVRADRLPPRGSAESRGILSLAPDLVAEVALPNQYRPGMAAKAQTYLSFGVRLVWVVWPEPQEIDVWRPGADQPVQTLRASDMLDGLDVVPGFTHPIADLFVGE